MGECRDYVIWGSAGHAKVVAEVIGFAGGRVVALFDNNPTVCSCLAGVPLHIGTSGFQDWIHRQRSLDGVRGAIAIGGARGADRQQILDQMQSAGLHLPPLIHPDASVSPSAQMGVGSQVLAQAVIAADTVMGTVCIVNHGANVDHECHLGNGVHIAPGAVLCGCVEVGENAMVGAGAVVLPRIKIGRQALIGIGAVVTRDVSDRAVVIGNPARSIRSLI